MSRNGSQASPAVLKASERRKECARLRVEGMSPNDIARKLGNGLTARQVRADLRQVARSNDAEAQMWNYILVERNEEMWRQLQKGIKKGDLWSIDRGFQCLDRSIALTGADKVANDSGSEVDKFILGSVEDGGFEEDEEELLGPVIEEYDDLEPDDLDEQLDVRV